MTRNAQLPPGAWDSHVHVINEEKFPFSLNRSFTPKKADVDDLIRFEESLGISHAVVVAASIYNNDNRSIVDAFDRMKGKGRGIACIDPDTVTEAELNQLDLAGVVGIRLGFMNFGATLDKEALSASLTTHADKIRSRGWLLQIFAAMNQYPVILPLTQDLGVDVVIDHLGYPNPYNPVLDPAGRQALLQALRSGRIWVKLSGTYRFSTTPGLDDYVKEVIGVAPHRIVWGSDWPHVGGPPSNPGGDRLQHQDFLKVDIPGYIDQCISWCAGDEDLIRTIWVDNPRRLWRYENGD